MSIIWQDDMESYPAGPLSHLTGWTNITVFDSEILAGSGIQGSKAYQLFGNIQRFESQISAVTIWFGFHMNHGAGLPTHIVDLFNGTGVGDVHAVNLCQLGFEGDSTMSIRANGTLLGNSGTATFSGINGFSVNQNDWYFGQWNVTFSGTATGTDTTTHLKVDTEFAINGTLLLSTSKITSIDVLTLPSPVAKFNLYQFNGAGIGPFMLDNILAEDLVLINTFPNPGTPDARVTQGVVEVQHNVYSQNARVSAGVVEIQERPFNINARVSAGVIELLIKIDHAAWILYEA